jgi:hypothetical protein
MKTRSRFYLQRSTDLPVSATTMTAASAVESTTTATTVVSTAAAMITATSKAASYCGPAITAGVSSTVSAAIAITASVAIPAAVAVTVPAAITIDAAVSVAITTTEPWTGADEDTAVKPRWTIVPVRSASVRSIAIVTIGANRSRVAVAPIHRATDANSD